jgi:hypothetical protein
MSSRPPVNVDVMQRTFYGVSFRTGLILVLTAIPVLAIVFAIGGLPFWFRGGLAILVTGLGLSLAFGQVNGQTPEAWLMEWFDFRGGIHFYAHRAQKQASEPNVTLPTQPPKTEPKAAPAVAAVHAKPVSLATQSTRAMPSFFFLTANTLGLALVTGLTLYLQQGGAERLIHLLHQF